MSHWRCRVTEGAEFWISCKRLKSLRKAGYLQLIQRPLLLLIKNSKYMLLCDQVSIQHWNYNLEPLSSYRHITLMGLLHTSSYSQLPKCYKNCTISLQLQWNCAILVTFLGIKLFCLSRQKSEIFSISLIFFSWNLTKFQLIRTTFIPRRKMLSECLSEWAEILQGFTKSRIKQLLKISAFYLDKQKSFITKKKLKCTMYHAAPYLVGVLGVPEHPRNLGVHKRGEAWFLLFRV